MRRFAKLWLVPIACLSLGIGFVACGDDDENGDGAGGTGGGGVGGTGGGGGGGPADTIKLSGNVFSHPLSQGATVDFESMELRLVDAGRFLTDPANAILATTDVESDGFFSFEEVDISDAQIGIVVTAEGDDIVTSTMAVCDLQASAHPQLACRDRSDFEASVVPTSLADTLENTLGNADLVTNGFILGMVLTQGTTPVPMEGVGVDVSEGDVEFLSESLGPTGGNATTSVGSFIVTDTPGVKNVAPTQLGTTFIPPSQQAGVSPGVAFQVFFFGTDDGGGGGAGGGGGGGAGGEGGGGAGGEGGGGAGGGGGGGAGGDGGDDA